MNKNKFALTIFVAALVLSMLACSIGAQPTATPVPTDTAVPTKTAAATDTLEPTDVPEPTETVAAPPAKDTETPDETAAPDETETSDDATQTPEDGASDGTSSDGTSSEHEVPEGELGVGLRTSWNNTLFETWEISGLVVNNTDKSYDNVEIEIEVFDANDVSLYKNTISMDLWVLGPGESSPFSTSVSESDAPGADSFTATITGQSTAYEEVERPDVTIENITDVTNDDASYTYLTGEVVNNSTEPVQVRTLAAALFDADGELLTADSYSVELGYVEPGERGPFFISVASPEDVELDTYIIYPDVIVADAIEDYDVTVSEDVTSYMDATFFEDYHVVGTVTNNTDEWMSLSIIAALYDADGNVIDVADGYLPFSAIEAGETLPFDVTGWSVVSSIDGMLDKAETVKWWIDPTTVYESSYEMITLATTNDANTEGDGSIDFTGTVNNETDKKMGYVYVMATVYEKGTQNIIGYNTTYLYEGLNAGSTVDYEISVYLPADVSADNVDVVIVAKGTEE